MTVRGCASLGQNFPDKSVVGQSEFIIQRILNREGAARTLSCVVRRFCVSERPVQCLASAPPTQVNWRLRYILAVLYPSPRPSSTHSKICPFDFILQINLSHS